MKKNMKEWTIDFVGTINVKAETAEEAEEKFFNLYLNHRRKFAKRISAAVETIEEKEEY